MRFLKSIKFVLVCSAFLLSSLFSAHAAAPPPPYGGFGTQSACINNALTLAYADAIAALRGDCFADTLADDIEARFVRLDDINTRFESGYNNTVLENYALTFTDTQVDDFEVVQKDACVTGALALDYTDAIDRLNNVCESSALAAEVVARFNRLVAINNAFEVNMTVAELQELALSLTDVEIDAFEANASSSAAAAAAAAASDIAAGTPGDTHTVVGLGLDHLDELNQECPDPVAGFSIGNIIAEVQAECTLPGCPSAAWIQAAVTNAINSAQVAAINSCTLIDFAAVQAVATAEVLANASNPNTAADAAATAGADAQARAASKQVAANAAAATALGGVLSDLDAAGIPRPPGY